VTSLEAISDLAEALRAVLASGRVLEGDSDVYVLLAVPDSEYAAWPAVEEIYDETEDVRYKRVFLDRGWEILVAPQSCECSGVGDQSATP
jgi:hypothetical protein